jgi:hypothetical protein
MITSLQRSSKALLLLLLCGTLPQMASADPPLPKGAPPRKPAKATENDGKMSAMKEPIQFANVPEFTGHIKFLFGTVRQFPLGESWMEYFIVKERAQDVYDWYNQVLPMQQWKITSKNFMQLCAQNKDGNQVTVSAQSIRDKDGNCRLCLSYFVPKKDH